MLSFQNFPRAAPGSSFSATLEMNQRLLFGSYPCSVGACRLRSGSSSWLLLQVLVGTTSWGQTFSSVLCTRTQITFFFFF